MRGLVVLEAAEGIAGPVCGVQLANMGARVIKVEPLAGDRARTWGPPFLAGEAAAFLGMNRNKESLAVAADRPESRPVLQRLIARSDVLIEHLRPDSPEWAVHLGQDPVDLNPRLIHIRVSANGSRGPMAGQAGSELTAQAMSGYWRVLGNPDQPPLRHGAEIAEVGTGMFAYQAILAALYRRRRSGAGQAVDLSLLGTLMATGTILAGAMTNPDDWTGFHLLNILWPPDTGFQTADGHVTLEFRRGKHLWEGFCRKVGLEHLIAEPRFADWRSTVYTGDRVGETKAEYEAALRNIPTAKVVETVTGLGGTSVPYNSMAAATSHPQAESTGIFSSVPLAGGGRMRQLNTPFAVETAEPRPDQRAAPRLGEHTAEVLSWIGFSGTEIDSLLAAGVAALAAASSASESLGEVN